MSAPAESEVSKLKRSVIDHMVVTMVAGVMSGFLFLVWNLYANLERRVSEHDRESAASLMVLKEAVISYKVRLDVLEKNAERMAEAPKPVATVSTNQPFWTPAPVRAPQQQQQPQQQMSTPMVQELKSIERMEAARSDFQKKILESRPAKP